MNKFLDGMKRLGNETFTENGAAALKSTMNKCLDAFGSLGAMKASSEGTIVNTFKAAFYEDRVLAMRMLFYFRDIRGGQGCRRVFRVILKWLAENYPEFVIYNFDNILEFGRGDDYLCLLDTKVKNDVATYLYNKIFEDWERHFKKAPISLLAKWLPSGNASSKQTKTYARILMNKWHWTPKNYRKVLSELRAYIDVVEKKMSARNWTRIDYEKVPAKAAMTYSNAFYKHDEKGYTNYIRKVASGDVAVKSKTLYPSDIVSKVKHFAHGVKDKIFYNALWENLPNYFDNAPNESAICMVDTSGSMSGEPYDVAVALGLYCADKCNGPFHNHFITFATHPSLVEVRGKNIFDKVNSINTINAGNTDIEAAFNLILTTAIANHCKQEDIPAKLYIISDMQFDEARSRGYSWERNSKMESMTFMQLMRKKFTEAGYEMPALVYWNVRASKCGMFQETIDGENIAMVSGYSPMLFEAVIEGTTYEVETNDKGEKVTKQKIDPMNVMLTTLARERYDRVWVGENNVLDPFILKF